MRFILQISAPRVPSVRVIGAMALLPTAVLLGGCAAVLADFERPLPSSHSALVATPDVVNPPRPALPPKQTAQPAEAAATAQRPQYKTSAPAAPYKAAFGSVVFSPSRYGQTSFSPSPGRKAQSPRLAQRMTPQRNRVEPNSGERPFDVWERIRRGFGMPDLTTVAAERSTTWYAAQPASINRMAQRAVPYLFHIVEEIEKRGMPTELALLPFVESAMQPEAKSHANAVGLWQFIPSTGRMYELEQNALHDQRSHITESTRAALDYLEKLFDDFGHWHLALAAYNCGEGCVQRALNRARAYGNSLATYEELDLPYETRGYVPKLQAIKNIVRNPEGYGLELPVIKNEPYFFSVTKTRDIDISTAALLAEMTEEEFRKLNPAFKRPVIAGATRPSILLPTDRKEAYFSNLAAWEAAKLPLASWASYTLQGSETLRDIAHALGISESALREANRIPAGQHVPSGTTILIPRDKSLR